LSDETKAWQLFPTSVHLKKSTHTAPAALTDPLHLQEEGSEASNTSKTGTDIGGHGVGGTSEGWVDGSGAGPGWGGDSGRWGG